MLGTEKIVELGYQWAVKVVVIAVVLALFQTFVAPYVDELKVLMLWWTNQTLFRVFSEAAVEFMNQAFVFIITFGLLLWIFHSDGDPAAEHNSWMYKK